MEIAVNLDKENYRRLIWIKHEERDWEKYETVIYLKGLTRSHTHKHTHTQKKIRNAAAREKIRLIMFHFGIVGYC